MDMMEHVSGQGFVCFDRLECRRHVEGPRKVSVDDVRAHPEYRAMLATLGAAQARCTALETADRAGNRLGRKVRFRGGEGSVDAVALDPRGAHIYHVLGDPRWFLGDELEWV